MTNALEAASKYMQRHGIDNLDIKAALIDMDGVLYDSMKYHTLAWQRMMTELGVKCTREEFYLYEGMTGIATIKMLFEREFGRIVSDDEARKLYSIKTEYFQRYGKREMMPGAERMLQAFCDADVKRVLVTGSGQQSLITTLNHDYPDMFADDMRVTAADVTHGKPDPEPYLRGLEKAGTICTQTMVVENAPLGVKSGHASGCFVVAVTTGPIPEDEMLKAGADLVYASMSEFADALPQLLLQLRHS